jgi:hypothetical protein
MDKVAVRFEMLQRQDSGGKFSGVRLRGEIRTLDISEYEVGMPTATFGKFL